jgi:hypothetical protein
MAYPVLWPSAIIARTIRPVWLSEAGGLEECGSDIGTIVGGLVRDHTD